MRLIARKRLRWRQIETPKRSEKKSVWAVAREYITFVIAVAAFGASIFSLYISHYGGPQDFRVTVYLPNAVIQSSDFVYPLGTTMPSEEYIQDKAVPEQNAKSFKLSMSGNMAFINSGSAPVLVDLISYIIPVSVGHIDCEGYYGWPEATSPWAVVDWTASPFVVPPGQIITKTIEFHVHRSLVKEDDPICFQFTIVDRSGTEKILTVPGIRFVPDYGIDAPPIAFNRDPAQLGWAKRRTYILLESLF